MRGERPNPSCPRVVFFGEPRDAGAAAGGWHEERFEKMLNGGLPRVTILMNSAGGGHLASAESLCEALAGRAEVTMLNLLDEHAPFPFNRISDTYGPLVNRAPRVYRMLYRSTTRPLGKRFVERGSYPIVRTKMRAPLLATRPDLVISVNALLTGVPLRMLRASGSQVPFVTVVTDPASMSLVWFAPDADLVFVADDEARRTALSYGMRPDRVVVSGLPIRRSFAEARLLSKEEARSLLGLSPTTPLVLMAGGGAGVGRIPKLAEALARRLAATGRPVQMAAIAGNNARLRARLQGRDWPIPFTVVGYTDRMAEWMAAADILLTKAGPGTIAEAACLGLPTLLTGYIPGQEEGNIEWARRHGRTVFMPDPEEASILVERWLRPGSTELEAMSFAMRRMSRCDAAPRIVETALGLVREPVAAGA
jgi:1,2-diacylglycerol 3-beta-galactosyltransferase